MIIPLDICIYTTYSESFFDTDTSQSVSLHDNAQTFMVEVVHNVLETIVQFTNQVSLRYFNLFKMKKKMSNDVLK
jgi:hypothetical protein